MSLDAGREHGSRRKSIARAEFSYLTPAATSPSSHSNIRRPNSGGSLEAQCRMPPPATAYRAIAIVA